MGVILEFITHIGLLSYFKETIVNTLNSHISNISTRVVSWYAYVTIVNIF